MPPKLHTNFTYQEKHGEQVSFNMEKINMNLSQILATQEAVRSFIRPELLQNKFNRLG
jgi:hypothetical protein